MEIKHRFAENVVMTEFGVMKICPQCLRTKPLYDFRFSRTYVWQRAPLCIRCEIDETTKLIG